jgi:phytoene dehydrogenase-like protein
LDWLLDTQQLVTTRHPASLPRRQLLRQLLRLAPNRSTRRAIARMFSTTLVEMIVDTFESDPLRALCTYWGSMIGPIDAEGTGFFCVSLAAVHRQPGVMRPLGGMGALVRALEACLRDRGGSVRTRSRVVRIHVEGDRATGVLLDDGTKLTARRGVLASCAPQVALGPLLEEGTLDPATQAKVAVLPANANGSATLKVDLALSGRADYPTAQARRDRRDPADLRRTSLMTGTLEDQLRQLREIKRGSSLACAPMYMSILSSNDASIAPAGQDVVYLASNMPVAPARGWEVEKDRYAEIVLSSASRFMGGLEHEIGRVVSTPADFEERCNAPRGAYFHVDMGPLRVGMNRPARGLGGYATPVSGLYLAGAGSHPGGGVSGWPGRLAAQAALRANGTSTS